ncbi:MAG: CBS domain-containing protein [Polyangiaceae bacterium]
MQHPVTSASIEDTAAYAARLMNETKAGAVVVVDPSGRLAGLVTERDLVREVLATNTPAEVHLGRIAKPAVRCSLHDSLALAEAKMVEYGSHYVVVCDDGGTPRGIIGIMDLARYEDARQAANVLFRIAGREVRS